MAPNKLVYKNLNTCTNILTFIVLAILLLILLVILIYITDNLHVFLFKNNLIEANTPNLINCTSNSNKVSKILNQEINKWCISTNKKLNTLQNNILNHSKYVNQKDEILQKIKQQVKDLASGSNVSKAQGKQAVQGMKNCAYNNCNTR